MNNGTQISDMTPIAFDDAPGDAALPWVVEDTGGGFSNKSNYRTGLIGPIRDRPTSATLAMTTGAAAIGSNDGQSGSLWTTVAGFISYLLSTAGSNIVGFLQAGAGAVARTVQQELRERVSVTQYGAVGNGITDDSAACLACINANKGKTIVFPAGYTFYVAGLILSGSTYNGTRLVIEGTIKFVANPNPASGNFQTTTYCCIVFHDCDSCSIAIPGVIDGNRTAQAASQQQHLVFLAGVTNFFADDGWSIREIRGDAFVIAKKTLADPASANSDTVYIGTGVGINSANDGRNIVSVISGLNVTVAGGISRRIGGIINAERMPGGFDCEPDHNAGHYVENLTVGFWDVETIGTSGFAVIGASISGNDALRDWNIVNVQCAGALVKHTDATGLIGGPIFRRASKLSCGPVTLSRASRNAGFDLDYLDYGNITLIASGVSQGVAVGLSDWVNDFTIDAKVTDHSASAMIGAGFGPGTIASITARNPQGAGSYGLNLINNGRAGLTITGASFHVNCSYSANLSFGMRSAGLAFGAGTAVIGGTLLGYPGYALQYASTDSNYIPTRNIEGRNFATAVPTTGTWARGDFVGNTAVAAGGTPGWYNTSAGSAVWKAAANVAA